MKDLFSELLGIKGVEGIMLLDASGKILFGDLTSPTMMSLKNLDALPLIDALGKMREVEMIFEDYNIYIRTTGKGYILVLMKESTAAEKVRSTCATQLHELTGNINRSSGIRRFFKRKIGKQQ